MPPRSSCGPANWSRISRVIQSYPGTVEIEIRVGFCDPDGELLAVLERSDWRRISIQRRGEIVDEMVRVCDETERGIAEAWRRRDDGLRGSWSAIGDRRGLAERVMTANGSAPTITLADLLIALRERVPMSEAQIARATRADRTTVAAWLERREAPDGLHAQRLTELVAFVQEMARNVRGDALAEWLDGTSTAWAAPTPSTRSPKDATSR